MISVKWMGVFVLCQTVFCIEQPYRLVENTTCLEMKKQDRLSCVKGDEYHCLLDENYINEYEVCREWKWIPKGKCAYFNTYNRGNVDERDCKPTQGFTCAPVQHRSTESKKYNACYVKKEITTQINQISTSTRPVTSDGGNSISSNSTGSDDKIGQSAGKMVAAVVFGVLIPLLIIALIILRFKHLKRLEEFRKKDIELGNGENENLESPRSTRCQENTTENSTTECEDEAAKLLEASSSRDHIRNMESDFITEGKSIPPLDESAGDVIKTNEVTENIETKEEINENNTEQKGSKNTENTMKMHEMLRRESACSTIENENREEIKKRNSSLHGTDTSAQSSVDSKELKSDNPSQHANGMVNTEKEEINNSSVPFPGEADDAETISNDRGTKRLWKYLHQELLDTKDLLTTEAFSREDELSSTTDRNGSVGEKEGSVREKDEKKESRGEKQDPVGVKQGLTGDEEASTNEMYEIEKSTGEKRGLTGEKVEEPVQSSIEDEPSDVFDDTAESLQKEMVDDTDTELCQNLYEFLHDVYNKRARKVLRSVLSKNAEKSPDDILKDVSIQNELRAVLPAEYHASISSMSDSVAILYGLIRKFLKEKDTPKSGWNKPVRNTDIRIGDDVERLYRVHSIIRGISDPVKIPVEGYERLLKVINDIFTRLDSDEEFKDDRKKLSNKLHDIRSHYWLQKSLHDAIILQ